MPQRRCPMTHKLKTIAALLTSAVDTFLFPPTCLYCHGVREAPKALFCHACSELLELLDPDTRCSGCFAAAAGADNLCRDCRKLPRVMDSVAAAYEYVGPAACLVRCFKYGRKLLHLTCIHLQKMCCYPIDIFRCQIGNMSQSIYQ